MSRFTGFFTPSKTPEELGTGTVSDTSYLLGSEGGVLKKIPTGSASIYTNAIQQFKTVALFESDEVLDYDSVAPGDIIEAGGFRYQVVASDAATYHLESAGGVRVVVVPIYAGASGGLVPVAAFGAKFDGSTDDTAAFQAAAASDFTAFVLSAGTAVLTDTVDFTGPVSVVGQGMTVTSLQFTGADGLTFTGLDGEDDPATIQGFSLLQTSNALYTAIAVDNSAQIDGGSLTSRTNPRLVVRDVNIRGASGVTVDGWAKGLVLTSVLHAVIDSYHFSGRWQTTQDNHLSVAAIEIGGSGNPVEIMMSNIFAYHTQTAIDVADTEGIFLTGFNFVNVGIGVNFDGGAGEPQLSMTDGHIAFTEFGVYGDTVNQVNITKTLFYGRDPAPADMTAIRLLNCSYGIISGNTFVDTNATYDMNGIVISGVSGDEGTITGNVFQSGAVAIWLQATCSGWRVGPNTYCANLTGSKILESGSGNYIPGKFASVGVNATFSLANSTAAAVSWNTVTGSGDGQYYAGGNPTRMTADVDGVYRVGGQIVFASNATGYRKAAIRKNGSEAKGFPISSVNAVNGTNTTISLDGQVTLTAGDYIELFAEQNSGSSMTIPNAQTTMWLEYVGEVTT